MIGRGREGGRDGRQKKWRERKGLKGGMEGGVREREQRVEYLKGDGWEGMTWRVGIKGGITWGEDREGKREREGGLGT